MHGPGEQTPGSHMHRPQGKLRTAMCANRKENPASHVHRLQKQPCAQTTRKIPGSSLHRLQSKPCEQTLRQKPGKSVPKPRIYTITGRFKDETLLQTICLVCWEDNLKKKKKIIWICIMNLYITYKEYSI